MATNTGDGGSWVTARVGRSGFRADVSARSHELKADEPVDFGGTDIGPTPYEYLLAAIGTCTAMTLRFYADRKSWPLESAEVSMRQSRPHEADCEKCATEEVGISRVERRIHMVGPLSDDQRKRLLEVADRCPVKQTLARGIRVDTAVD